MATLHTQQITLRRFVCYFGFHVHVKSTITDTEDFLLKSEKKNCGCVRLSRLESVHPHPVL